MITKLAPVIHVDSDKCVNCHRCISVCPVKFCIDGSGDKVEIDHNMCIGCGHCIPACTHKARSLADDGDIFFHDLKNGKPMIAIAAPAIASSFPEQYLQLNDYFHSKGVEAVFDVSFGAELTVKSYLEHLKKNNPEIIIAQPCPAIVSYIEIYKPELITHLAPAHSPMLHTIVMIREFYPQYKDHSIVIFSPCLAKKREYQETGLGDYNLTFLSIEKHLEENHIDLSQYETREYINPAPERAVLFPMPGGLMKTAERDLPGLTEKTRKIEGSEMIYPYLTQLPDAMKKGYAPLLIDCLNCEIGCNGGPGTKNHEKNVDEVEFYIQKRRKEVSRQYQNKNLLDQKEVKQQFYDKVNKHWKAGIYKREYQDLHHNNHIKIPDENQLRTVYHSMKKYDQKDFYNCTACGYGSCESMAIAIYNSLNKVENCYHYSEKVLMNHKTERGEIIKKQEGSLKSAKEITNNVHFLTETASDEVNAQLEKLEETLSLLTDMFDSVNNVSELSKNRIGELGELMSLAESGGEDMENTVGSIKDIKKGADDIKEAIDVIRQVAEDTRILSMNAEIEAAQAGETGKGFSVVAEEIRRISDNTKSNALSITVNLESIVESIDKAESVAVNTEGVIIKMIDGFEAIAKSLKSIYDKMMNLAEQSNQISDVLDGLKSFSNHVQDAYSSIFEAIKEMQDKMETMSVSDSVPDNKIPESLN